MCGLSTERLLHALLGETNPGEEFYDTLVDGSPQLR